MEIVIQVHKLDEAVCISFCANALEKGKNPVVSPPARKADGAL